ncbi:hypothetical protein [Shimazuella alba]|uniref:Uncharacterized protein n=1 Tax=Shimazuella alba TaxID=2690964 RepID=A0A6I4VMJ6_9BACL|nr:hypothetical protein [Shimazuella alba]MXQ52879.1 hypothetical protein [Shimazuella alba]
MFVSLGIPLVEDLLQRLVGTDHPRRLDIVDMEEVYLSEDWVKPPEIVVCRIHVLAMHTVEIDFIDSPLVVAKGTGVC